MSFKEDDILLAYWHDKDSQSGAFKGFREMKFRVTALSGEEGFIIVPKPGSGSIPAASMTLAQTGNFTDAERQTYIMIDSTLGNNSLTFLMMQIRGTWNRHRKKLDRKKKTVSLPALIVLNIPPYFKISSCPVKYFRLMILQGNLSEFRLRRENMFPNKIRIL